MSDDQVVKSQVREYYGQQARAAAQSGGERSCCGDASAKAIRSGLYQADDLAVLPDQVAETSWGSGNPVRFAGLQPGEVVLDLGSGGGLDCLLAAQQVGPGGKAIGVDMTDDMLALARANAAKAGARNVEFRKGEMEALPVDDGSVDVIISNCVINLSPDKSKVFAEAFRVLRQGGRFVVSDIVLTRDLTAEMKTSSRVWCECIAGALRDEEFLGGLEAVGFVDVHIAPEGSHEYVPGVARSVLVRARKP